MMEAEQAKSMGSSWQDKPVTILGLSKSGAAAARYLAERGARCFLSETLPATPMNKSLRDEMAQLGVTVETGGHSEQCYSHSNLVVVSPGIPPSSQVIKELSVSGKDIISEVELAYRETAVPFIGITGTNGKTTTTTLISVILESAGKGAPACGNIGTPIISLVPEGADYFVAELSSFQLFFSPTLTPKIALFLNFRPDHLDWHGSVEAYKRAKFMLFEGLHSPEWLILNASDPACREAAEVTRANVLWFARNPADLPETAANTVTLNPDGNIEIRIDGRGVETLLNIRQIQLVGGHNQENVLAAAAACFLLDVTPGQIARAVETFGGVEHRLEPVGVLNGIAYYNDSKATNPDAAISALSAFAPRQVVLIAGGRDKKTDLSEFVDAVKTHAHHVVLLGEAADRFALELRAAGYTGFSTASSLDDAILQASRNASEAVPVLFSPACASFDMFRNFEERGQAFKMAVQRLFATVS